MTRPFVWSLPPRAQAVPLARQRLQHRCGDLPAPLLDDALLVVSELVTNAVKHGDGEITLRLWPGPDLVRIEVTDESPRYPEPVESDLDDEAGRGLQIVGALASSWGATPASTSWGKTVWVELAASRD